MHISVLILWITVFVISLLKVVLGTILFKFTPTRNSFFGYKTKQSLKDDESWLFSNKLSAKLILIIGLIELIVSVLTMIFTYKEYDTANDIIIPFI
ncbi:hypothetical protein BN85403190 [Alteracholeplasma palmae J233]|uniref:SdpI family protein n=1 Tax=Alteracholeplasma palmae (strain ATCC 49389 / J233) TaxID=1318466 RepID=U4KR58_ALTPJ|nr:SdpI family protein [Alteracholeplasma palmae]CCV63896.1 hypothetical protein BN85403190 [Alteracholeplasma palmae J233]